MRKRLRRGDGHRCLLVGAVGDSLRPVGRLLESAGFTPVVAASDVDAVSLLERESFSCAIVSLLLDHGAVSSIVAATLQQPRAVPLLALGATGTVEEAVDAMQRGAADYVPRPVEDSALLARIGRLLARRAVAAAPQSELGAPFTGLVGSSPAIRRVLAAIEKISRYKTSVLVLGESGTGKELIARALHARGPRRQQLFVPINCATLGRELLENELFGHEKGAFTGATERKKGIFELADGGTLFLDEIAEMDPSTQAKLLRVLERNEFRRVGGTSKVRVDLSVVAATNRNLGEAIRVGRFREDLYYRLKVVTLAIPPLRERREDIPALIEAFIADFNRRNGGKIQGISPQALRVLMTHEWPGNVRELKNAVESAAILAGGDTIDPESLSDVLGGRAPVAEAAPTERGGLMLPAGATLAQAERLLIASALERCRSKREAAAALGIGLRTLYTKLQQGT